MMRKPESRLREEVLQFLERDDRRSAGELLARPLLHGGRSRRAQKGERVMESGGSRAVMAIGRVQHPTSPRG
ncbi:hypothetical protein JTE90_028798 [Oedothorax gibbosus]|uniref:Uncharacterized protein n=1 Tax=Oedothorax gibbosus TaxID=931172 RepID=A0AAV6VY68_9ARAC|nr:hypothetical protein JTE90_028798 [Oedothorax gibbosus]